MVLNFYMNMLIPSCRSLYIFARMNYISFQVTPVDLMKGEHRSEEFIQMSPLMKVPVMKDEDFTLGESVAIMLYLCRRFKTPDYWYPVDPHGRARVDEYLAWQHLNLKKHCAKAFWMKMVIPHFFKHTVSGEKLKVTMENLNHSLDLLKEKFLKDKPYLTGDRISLADLMAVEDVVQAITADYDVFENRPWLRVWKEKVEALLNKQVWDEVREPIHKLKDAPTLSSDVVRKFDLAKNRLL